MVLRPQRILSLCSGAGGLDLGVHDALGGRARTVVFVEHEVTACEVLAARIADHALDDAPIWGDLHAFDARGWRGRVDGIIGGYPCQPFSVAGKRLGTADPRHLWPSIARIIAECEPGWCFFENVAGHLRLGYFDVVRPDLERLGYRVTEGLFTAAEVGAPHQRERLFILAHRESSGCEALWPIGRGDEQGETGTLVRSGDVAHAADDHWRRGEWRAESGTGAHGERRGRPASSGYGMADTGDGQLSQPRRRPQGRDGAGPAIPQFPPGPGDRDGSLRLRALLPDAELDEGGRVGDRHDPSVPVVRGNPWRVSDLSAFPPGPSDRDAWSRILRDYPDLAPAVEPPLHGVAAGLEAGMDLSRAARLRITGNGVVPQCASLAFRTLWGQLADTGHTERTGGAGDEE